ncbi:MAG TPA: hypothetical protein VN455_08760, partial [Methanotrichaceae archaeon]|nr:hypothetical protein [Methanotrichaceae archaeon]
LCTAMACVMAAGAQPNIDLQKNASPVSGAPSTNVSFDVTATNTGNVSFGNVRIIDLLPAGMTFLPTTAQPPADNVSPNRDGTTTISWDNVSPSGLDPGNVSPISFQAHIDGKDTSGRDSYGNKTNLAAVQATTVGGLTANATASATVRALNAEIQATKKANKTSAAPLSYVEFILKITNTGNATFKAVQVADLLHTGLSFVSTNVTADVSSEPISWTFNETLNPGQSIFISLIAKVDANAKGTLVNEVAAMGLPENGDPVLNINPDNRATVTVIRPRVVRPDDTNRDTMDIGKEVALAFTASFFGKDAARATNDLEIKKNQDSGECVSCPDGCNNACVKHNLEKIWVGDRDASAHGSGDSNNHVKLVSNQV